MEEENSVKPKKTYLNGVSAIIADIRHKLQLARTEVKDIEEEEMQRSVEDRLKKVAVELDEVERQLENVKDVENEKWKAVRMVIDTALKEVEASMDEVFARLEMV